MLKHQIDLELRIREFVRSVRHRDEGASAVEYGLLVALIAVVIIAAVALLGRTIESKFSEVATKIS